MNEAFVVTGALAAFGGLSHAYLGERQVLIPLTQRTELTATGSTMMVLRFTWHFFSVVMTSLAVVFIALAAGLIGGGDWTVVRVLAVYFAVFGALVLVLSRGRHFAWLIGFACGATAWLGTV